MLKHLTLAAFGGLLFRGAEAVAVPQQAEAATRCVAVAFRANGDRVRGTRSIAERGNEFRACNRAIRRCENNLNFVRHQVGRPLPFARCDVVRVAHVAPAYHAPPPRYNAPPPRYRAPAHCNVPACSAHYRSFRAHDCSFQPYGNRPRQRCRF